MTRPATEMRYPKPCHSITVPVRGSLASLNASTRTGSSFSGFTRNSLLPFLGSTCRKERFSRRTTRMRSPAACGRPNADFADHQMRNGPDADDA